jgi:HEAT repeat protein
MKRRTVIYSVVLLALAVIVGVLAFIRPREPSHSGRSVSEWIHQATEGPDEQRQQAIDAMLAMEPDLFPCLVRMTGRRDSRLKLWWSQSSVRRQWLGGRFQPRLAQADRDQALLAFQALGASATPAIPLLERLLNEPDRSLDAGEALCAIRRDTVPVFARALTNKSPVVRANAARYLGLLWTEGRPALPGLVACLINSDNSEPRAVAAWSIGQIARGFASTEPAQGLTNELAALTAGLADANASVRAASAAALFFFGTNARPAASTLRRLRQEEPDRQVSEMAEMALIGSGEWKWPPSKSPPPRWDTLFDRPDNTPSNTAGHWITR